MLLRMEPQVRAPLARMRARSRTCAHHVRACPWAGSVCVMLWALLCPTEGVWSCLPFCVYDLESHAAAGVLRCVSALAASRRALPPHPCACPPSLCIAPCRASAAPCRAAPRRAVPCRAAPRRVGRAVPAPRLALPRLPTPLHAPRLTLLHPHQPQTPPRAAPRPRLPQHMPPHARPPTRSTWPTRCGASRGWALCRHPPGARPS